MWLQVNKLFGVNYMSPSGSEMLLSAPRSHGLPVNNQQHRIHNRAISSHHSRLNGRHHTPNVSADLNNDEIVPLLSSSDSNQQHQVNGAQHIGDDFLIAGQQEPNQYFNNNSPQNGKSEKDTHQELHGSSSKILHKDQQSSCNNNSNSNDNNNSTNHNNNNITSSSAAQPLAGIASPTSSSSRLFFPWTSSFFTRNFRFARQSGYRLTRSVTLLMTRPERLEFLASTQNQFPDEFGYYGESDEGARLLHDETYYPSCSSPPPPPFLTPSPDEAEEDDVDVHDQCGHEQLVSMSSSSANNDNGNDVPNRSALSYNNRHYHRHQPSSDMHNQHYHRTSLVMAEVGNCSSPNYLAPSYSQALLLMEPNERNSFVASLTRSGVSSANTVTTTSNNTANSPSHSTESLVVSCNTNPPGFTSAGSNTSSMSARNSTGDDSGAGLGAANLTNEQENPAGFTNVTMIGNDRDSLVRGGTGNCELNEARSLFCGEHYEPCGQEGSTYATTAHYLRQNTGRRKSNCPIGSTPTNARETPDSREESSGENPTFTGNVLIDMFYVSCKKYKIK